MDELIPLSNTTLGSLPATIRVPRYDRSTLKPGIVHVGLGNFHRAHQAWYLHRLFEKGLDHDWAILGAGVRPADALQRDKLLAQDCLTTLIELDPAGTSAEVTGAMTGFIEVEDDNAALIRRMADPAIRIVALTVTEGGYYLDPRTGGLATGHPDILHDAQTPERPRTVFGAMVAALRARRDAGDGPFTGLSCDNLQGNGAILRRTVVGLAHLSDPDLAEWIDTTCSFPNSMVDCIVPATGAREMALARSFGIDDHAPVTHENFRQWVIEDDFCAGRPAWEKVGVTLSNDVHAFETMKIRILNGGHQVLANPGEILGLETIADCMAHPLVSAFFSRVQAREIVPQVHPVPGMTPAAYVELIERRFANPTIIDTTRRVAFDGSSRHTGFLLPVLRERRAAGLPIKGLALAEALWARMCEGTREDGSAIAPNDPDWSDLQETAKRARERPAAWLAQSRIYGDLTQDTGFADAFTHWLALIWEKGTETALTAYLET